MFPIKFSKQAQMRAVTRRGLYSFALLLIAIIGILGGSYVFNNAIRKCPAGFQ
jgi:hypothetical protein